MCPGHDERSKVIEYSHFAPEMPLLWMKPCEETGRPRGQILVDWASRLAQQLAPPALHATAWIGKIIRVHANLLARRQERRQRPSPPSRFQRQAHQAQRSNPSQSFHQVRDETANARQGGIKHGIHFHIQWLLHWLALLWRLPPFKRSSARRLNT